MLFFTFLLVLQSVGPVGGHPLAVQRIGIPTAGRPSANAPTVAQQTGQLAGRIIAVHDADTYTLQNTADAKPYKIRILNVDAPELSQAFGKAARDSVARLILNQLAIATGPNGNPSDPPKPDRRTALQRDIYGRTLALVTTTTGPARYKRLDSLMLVNGWAWHIVNGRPPAYDPGHRSQASHPDAQGWTTSAQERQIGLWACDWPCPPWLYRKYTPSQKQINCPCKD